MSEPGTKLQATIRTLPLSRRHSHSLHGISAEPLTTPQTFAAVITVLGWTTHLRSPFLSRTAMQECVGVAAASSQLQLVRLQGWCPRKALGKQATRSNRVSYPALFSQHARRHHLCSAQSSSCLHFSVNSSGQASVASADAAISGQAAVLRRLNNC